MLSLLLVSLAASAQLRLAPIFSDNAVLQREQPIHIWGKASPGKTVGVVFGNESKTTVTQKDSSWNIYLKKRKADIHPQTLFISCGAEKITLNNILIGDVWLCSGQSNMEWPVAKEAHWSEEKKNAYQPLIRFNNPPPAGRYVYGVAYPDSLNRRLTSDSFYLWTSWQNCDSNTIKDVSAVGYYFAKTIVEKTGVPVGFINLSIGGAPIETFISREAMQNDSRYAPKVAGDWLVNKALPEWIRERGGQNVGGNRSGYQDDLGLNHAYKPGFAYASGVKPLLPFPIKGILWYQGESNSLEKDRVEEYKDLLHVMIDDYRAGWQQPDLPFYWVQLSSIDTTSYQSKYWPQFRDEQRRLLSEVKQGGMAVSSDVGFKENVHPTNKKVVGERLARWALAQVYGGNSTPSGPLPVRATYKDGKVIISFQYAAGLKTSDGKPVCCFLLDGKPERDATIQNNTIVLAATQKPGWVYYGWEPFSRGNLVNSENLPASTFKVEVK